MRDDIHQAGAPVPDSPGDDWLAFPGGELEGRRPRVLCRACRERGQPPEPNPRRAPLCFQCYRAQLERDRKLAAAARLDTASNARFQIGLPFEPVNRPRLAALKAKRAQARASARQGTGAFAERRRLAQISARRAVQAIAAGAADRPGLPAIRLRMLDAAVHAAELQLPESWLPFVVSR